MVGKYSSISKMTLYFWAPSEMTTGCYEVSFLWFANAREAETLQLSDARSPRLTVYHGKRPEFARWGCSRIELIRTLFAKHNFGVICFSLYGGFMRLCKILHNFWTRRRKIRLFGQSCMDSFLSVFSAGISYFVIKLKAKSNNRWTSS